MTSPPLPLVGDAMLVPCVDGVERPYLAFDVAASTGALPSVLDRVEGFLPTYSSIHRGAGYKSQRATTAYEDARDAMMSFAGRQGRDDVAIICRNTTEAINHLAYRLRLSPGDVVLTTVIEHHANLLPWSRVATCRHIECRPDGTFTAGDVEAALVESPPPRLLTITGASNITGWLPPIDEIVSLAHGRGVQVAVDAAQLAPHRPLPESCDFIAWSGHKMYAPFGAGALIGPRAAFAEGDPFLVGGGAVDLVDLDEVVWSPPPEREEAGSPNVLGAIALASAIGELTALGWPAIVAHDERIADQLRRGLAAIPGVTLLGPALSTPTLPVASFILEGVDHALVAARLSVEHAIGVRHGCFCAHPYLVRLLGLSARDVLAFKVAARAHDRAGLPGAVRASAGLSTSAADVSRLCAAVADVASSAPPVPYRRDPLSGDYFAEGFPGPDLGSGPLASCMPG
jgi:selenocysteine lyase/cysteine desulfurase